MRPIIIRQGALGGGDGFGRHAQSLILGSGDVSSIVERPVAAATVGRAQVPEGPEGAMVSQRASTTSREDAK
jgi:hypothetical protein